MSIYPGNLLTATAASVAGSPTPVRTWQWLRNGTAISGKTASTYRLTYDDIGASVAVRQIESNVAGQKTATSLPVTDITEFDPSSLFAASEVGNWFDPSDLSTMFTDSAGTTPVTAPGQNVGLILDKGQGLVLGPELVTDGNFLTGLVPAGFVALNGGGLSVISEELVIDTAISSNYPGVDLSLTTEVGKWYKVVFTVRQSISNNIAVYIRDATGDRDAALSFAISGTDSQQQVIFIARHTTTNFIVFEFVGGSGTGTITLGRVSARELPGYHASQPTAAASRPVYGVVPKGPEVRNLVWNSVGNPWGFQAGAALDSTTVLLSGDTEVEYTSPGNANSGGALIPNVTAFGNMIFSVEIRGDVGGELVCLGTYSGGDGFQRGSDITLTTEAVRYYFTVNTTVANNFYVLDADSVAKTVHISKPQIEFGPTATDYQQIRGLTYYPYWGRRNLLTYTEDFSNAVWSKSNCTVTSANNDGPLGSSNGTLITFTSNGGNGLSRSTLEGLGSGSTAPWSFYLKYGSWRWFEITSVRSSVATRSWVDLLNLVAGTANHSGFSVTNLGNGWCRVSCSVGTTGIDEIYITPRDANGSSAGATTNNGTTFYVSSQQVENDSTATAYQKVNTAFDVTEAGVQTLHYLQFDGADDFLVTGTITPGVDKVQVFAGVRKLSDAAAVIVADFSANPDGNNGTFSLSAPATTGVGNYGWYSKGTTLQGSGAGTTYVSPTTNVLTGIGDISGDVTRLRVDGTQVSDVLLDQGTGNYLAHPMYIGRRGGAALPYNGLWFGQITRFSAANLDAAIISATEGYMAGKTGITL
jgi:hypothetical protein